MLDIRTRSEVRHGWWLETRATVPCALPPDGALAFFRLEDVEIVLDEFYPRKEVHGRTVWYFNETLDREIAEVNGDRVSANPQILWQHFLPT